MTPDTASALIQGIEAIAAAIAAAASYLVFRQTQRISRQQMIQNRKIHQEQMRLTKQQAFISVSERVNDLRHILPSDPHWDDVVDSANKLEVIAVAWKTKLADPDILRLTYGRLFMMIFEEIYGAIDTSLGIYRGRNIIARDCPTTLEVYREFCEYFDHADITKLP